MILDVRSECGQKDVLQIRPQDTVQFLRQRVLSVRRQIATFHGRRTEGKYQIGGALHPILPSSYHTIGFTGSHTVILPTIETLA